jgi:hypothetical protein
MKRYIVILFFFSFAAFGQSPDSTFLERNNELRLSFLNLLIESVDIQYERLINRASGLGLVVGIGYKAKESPLNTIFKVTPTYRYYFGEKKAAGFFVEGHARLSYDKGEREKWLSDSDHFKSYYQKEINVGLGVAAGGKLATKNGFVGVMKGGMGRFVTQKNSFFLDFFPIFELALGKRF